MRRACSGERAAPSGQQYDKRPWRYHGPTRDPARNRHKPSLALSEPREERGSRNRRVSQDVSLSCASRQPMTRPQDKLVIRCHTATTPTLPRRRRSRNLWFCCSPLALRGPRSWCALIDGACPCVALDTTPLIPHNIDSEEAACGEFGRRGLYASPMSQKLCGKVDLSVFAQP